MKVFEFITAICIMTLVAGFISRLIILIPISLLMFLFHKNEKAFLYGKLIKTYIVSSIIIFYIFENTLQTSLIVSLLYYVLGFYCYLIMFTLADETHNETIQERQNNSADLILLKASYFDKLMIIFSITIFILAIIFPLLTHFYVPEYCYNTYKWLITHKLISSIFYVFGALCVLYMINYTIILGRLTSNFIKRIYTGNNR